MLPFAAALTVVLTAHGTSEAYLNSAAEASKDGAAASRLTQITHGCHYSCECGPLKDFGCEQVYHRHLHMLCLPVRCRDQDCDPNRPKACAAT